MDSIFNQIRVKKQVIQDKYEKQYERVLFNFNEDVVHVTYYKELLEYLYSPLHHRERMLNRLKEIFEPTDIQIERLRNDNDSKVSFAIQWIMSILSAIIFFYGLSTVWYENTININKLVSDVFIDKTGIMPVYLTFLIISTILITFFAIIYFLIHNSSLMTGDMKKVIKTGQLDKTVIDKYLILIKKNNNKKKLLTITELLKMITTYVILNKDACEAEVDYLVTVIGKIE
jgi:hypothetical protein